jgi:spermidine synthase
VASTPARSIITWRGGTSTCVFKYNGAAVRNRNLLFFTALFLVSGFSGLIYQVVWQRVLQLYFGVSTFSITLIVAAYMCGLGLGYLLGGHSARHVRSPLTAYGLIEIGLGFFGLISPAFLLWVGRATAGSPLAIVFILSFLILLFPTVLMGATLPYLSQGFIHRVETSGQVVGLLYGINTLGAAFGAIISAFVLIGALGLNGTTYVAVALNLLVGLAAIAGARFIQERRADSEQETVTPAVPTATRRSWSYPTILTASFLVGFLGLGYEMVWIRVLGMLNKHSAYSFPTLLFWLLTGLAIGGYVFGKLADRSERPTRLLWQVEMAAAVIAALSFLILLGALYWEPIKAIHQALFYVFQQPQSPFTQGGAGWLEIVLIALREMALFTLPSLLLVLPASLVHGGGLVIVDRIAMDSPEMAGRRIGDMHLANIGGSLFGTLLVSFVLIPAVGSEWSLKLLMLVPLVLLGFDLRLGSRPRTRQPLTQTPAFYSAILLGALLLLPGRTGFFGQIFEQGLGRATIIQEGRDSVLTLVWQPADRKPDELWLGGELHSIFGKRSLVYKGYALTCSSASAPREILIIGFGGGNTTEFYRSIPGVERIVVVELLDDLGEFLAENIPSVRETLDDPRLTYIVDDGRRYLFANPEERFDLIAIDPLRNYTVGANNLYSREAMELYLTHLNAGGVLCAWMDEYRAIPKTVAEVFPYVDEFLSVMVASNQPIHYGIDTFESRARDAGIAIAPETVFGLFKRDQNAILERERLTPALTDLTPYLEYYFLRPPLPREPRTQPADIERFLERLMGCDEQCQNTIIDE